MCFVRALLTTFCAMQPAPMLSIQALIGRLTGTSSFSKLRKYSPSLHASEAEMYSASVDDVATVGCLEEMKLTRAPSMSTQLPEKDFLYAVVCPV